MLLSAKFMLVNRELLERKIAESGLDGIVAISGKSTVYLSGAPLPGTLGRLQDFPHTPRMSIVVWPREGAPTLIVPSLSLSVAQRASWIEDFHPYEEYVDSPMAVLATVLRRRGLDHAHLGIEKQYLGASRWEELLALLPGITFSECADLLESVRNIKTEPEITLFKRAAALLDETLSAVFRSARAGQAERELHADVIGGLLRRGAQYAHGMFRTSSNPVIYGGESPAPLRVGDIIQTDYVVYFDNYPANLSRVAVVGEPTGKQERDYAAILEIHRRTIDRMLRPDVSAADVFNSVAHELGVLGYPPPVPLVGHCLGVFWHQEEPILSPVERRPLSAGMLVCLEPRAGPYHLQDEILITDQGPKLLSDSFKIDEMFVISP